MLVLKPKEMCPYSSRCPYHLNSFEHGCWGARPDRQHVFTCDFVQEDGSILTNGSRSPYDKTGQMKILHG